MNTGSFVEEEDKYVLFFDRPSQLIETIDKIEEANLIEIQLIQENEQSLIDVQQKLTSLETEKNKKLNVLGEIRDDLKSRINQCEEEVRFTKKKTESFQKEEFSRNLDKIKAFLFQICQNFNGEFEKTQLIESIKELESKQTLMACLAQIEQLIYKYSLALKKENQSVIYKQVF